MILEWFLYFLTFSFFMNDKEKLEAIEWEMSFIYDELKLFDEEGFKQDSNSFLFRQTSRKEHRSLKTEWKILYRIREILEDKS